MLKQFRRKQQISGGFRDGYKFISISFNYQLMWLVGHGSMSVSTRKLYVSELYCRHYLLSLKLAAVVCLCISQIGWNIPKCWSCGGLWRSSTASRGICAADQAFHSISVASAKADICVRGSVVTSSAGFYMNRPSKLAAGLTSYTHSHPSLSIRRLVSRTAVRYSFKRNQTSHWH